MSALPNKSDGPVSVQTMTVSVNTLRIGSKQVTLSMFKQLPEADIYTDEKCNALKVQPWGVVRYFWGEYNDLSGAFHVVFVVSGALHRCYVQKPTERTWHGWVNASEWDRHQRLLERIKQIESSSFGKYGYGRARLRLEKRLLKIKTKSDNKLSAANKLVRDQMQAAHNAAYGQLAALPQLFIAI